MNRFLLSLLTLPIVAVALCLASASPANAGCPNGFCGGGNQTFAFVQSAPFVHYGAVQVQAFAAPQVHHVQRVFVQNSHAFAVAPQVNVQVNQQRGGFFRPRATRVRVFVR